MRGYFRDHTSIFYRKNLNYFVIHLRHRLGWIQHSTYTTSIEELNYTTNLCMWHLSWFLCWCILFDKYRRWHLSNCHENTSLVVHIHHYLFGKYLKRKEINVHIIQRENFTRTAYLCKRLWRYNQHLEIQVDMSIVEHPCLDRANIARSDRIHRCSPGN